MSLPQLAPPYLLSSALSWVTIRGFTVATWTPPLRPPPTPPPPAAARAAPALRPGRSASAAGDGGWAAAQTSRGGSGGWKVGEVSCSCFLFTVLNLRGAGSGCLLTGLGRGRGERVQEGKPHAIRQKQRAGGREQRQTDREGEMETKPDATS